VIPKLSGEAQNPLGAILKLLSINISFRKMPLNFTHQYHSYSFEFSGKGDGRKPFNKEVHSHQNLGDLRTTNPKSATVGQATASAAVSAKYDLQAIDREYTDWDTFYQDLANEQEIIAAERNNRIGLPSLNSIAANMGVFEGTVVGARLVSR
jgi:hypothetical protein